MSKTIRSLSRVAVLALTLQLVMSSPCQGSNSVWPFEFDAGRLTVISSPKELAEAKATLAAASEKNIPRSMLGGVLFYGRVITRLADDKFGQPIWLVRPERFLSGREAVFGDVITLVSPRVDAGGVDLGIGKGYKIFTVNIDGRHYIWNSVVTESDTALE